jgi:prolyl oligopeptidase
MRSFRPLVLTPPAVAASVGMVLAGCGDGGRRDANSASNTANIAPPAAIDAAESSARARTGAKVPTAKGETVDDYHGTKVSDPFRWLEEGDSDAVKRWTDLQNAATREHLDGIAGRERLRQTIRGILEVGLVAPPHVVARRGQSDPKTKGKLERRYFHTKREGGQNQPVLYVRDGVSGEDRVLLDPNALSSDGTTALDWWHPSEDGALVAWGRSEGGSEESTLYVRDVTTGKDLTDRIPHTRHASVAWLPGGKRFFYSRYPEPGSVPAGEEKYHSKIYEHVLGRDPKEDKLVFGEGRERTDIPQVSISPNGRWLIVRVHQGWQKSEVYVRDLGRGDKAPWVAVATGIEALYDPMPLNDVLYMLTNEAAPRFRLVAVDYARPQREAWKTIVAEAPDVLNDVAVIGSTLVASYMHEAATRLERFDRAGKPRGAIELPTLGTAIVSGAWDDEDAFIGFSSFATPPQVLRVPLAGAVAARRPASSAPAASPPAASQTAASQTAASQTAASAPAAGAAAASVWDQVGARFAMAGVRVSRLFATSKDGTRIPMFVVEREGTPRNGDNPTILYGYGGFNVNQTPQFSARSLTTVAEGGVWVTAILRGGGEFGEDWHRAGMLGNKQNVFDDFYACAEELVRQKITSPARLGIMGGSNGGLLVATAITQRPELFRAAASLVPLTDMLRYQHFRIAKLWVPEYGSSEDPTQFKWLYAYSPYHNVKDGRAYPSVLFTTAESDTRVDPMHARKMAARLQAAQAADGRPVLLRVETKAGHGAGKPVNKLTDELTDELSFLYAELGMKLDAPK